MRRYPSVRGWLVAVVLTGCVASPPGGPTRLPPATDAIVTTGDIQVA